MPGILSSQWRRSNVPVHDPVMKPVMVTLQTPNAALLPEYEAAVRTGWSPNNSRDVSALHVAAIEADPIAFLEEFDWKPGHTIALVDGSVVPRLPGRMFWIEAGGFCGVINLRHQPGTPDLPPHVSGHVGYAIVPWRRREGIATRALQMLLPVASRLGLERVSITTNPGNVASERVIRAAGGIPAGVRPDGMPLFWIQTAR